MVLINSIDVSPPLLNSSCAWSSSLEDLQALYDSPFTGAVTTRTATLGGFDEDQRHTVKFLEGQGSTINSYGYSPHPLSKYLEWVESVLKASNTDKPFIISISASTPEDLTKMVMAIQELRKRLNDSDRNRPSRIAVEFNTSCPNISGSSPSGYSFPSIQLLLGVLSDMHAEDKTLTIGLKLPPYTYREQYLEALTVLDSLAEALNGSSPIAYLASTNTLGSSLLFDTQAASPGSSSAFALPTPLGGLAGEMLHPLALGNVFSFNSLLRGSEARFPRLSAIKLVGIGGVTSKEAAKRMRDAGADVVGCATLFGREGVKAFENLSEQ